MLDNKFLAGLNGSDMTEYYTDHRDIFKSIPSVQQQIASWYSLDTAMMMRQPTMPPKEDNRQLLLLVEEDI